MVGLCMVARAVVTVPYIIRVSSICTSRSYATYIPSEITLYDSRKRSPCLPDPEVCITLPFPAINNIPTGIFRCTSGEYLGPCASKNAFYKNPEYYSYHDMSFYDFHHLMKDSRQEQPNTTRKPINF
ncbi:hypothetical protein O0L34_g9596 [Tuta absoluta]|nr:hypothetical protein O0L34_g9596 [Tuta absoluta]